MTAAQQLDFPSLAFPKDRTVLTVGEVAPLFRVTQQHVIDLLEEAKMDGFDIAGRHEYIRVPTAAIDALAKTFRAPRELIMKIIADTKPDSITTRAHWRIPVEGYNKFIQENRS